MKHYKAIFFDWDGTAVLSRKAPVEDAVNAMRPLLDKGVKLCIVSGTTYENIAGGKLHSYFTPKQLENLYLGLGRGAFDYGYDAAGQPTILVDRVPDAKGILAVGKLLGSTESVIDGVLSAVAARNNLHYLADFELAYHLLQERNP